jgi:hypothetical protein
LSSASASPDALARAQRHLVRDEIGLRHDRPLGRGVDRADIAERGPERRKLGAADAGGGAHDQLVGVSCTGASACTAVGSYDAGGGAQRSLIDLYR